MASVTDVLNSATTTSTAATTGKLNSLSSQDFMKLMITQLQHQDPMNPTNSDQMLSQLSQISNLQSNSQMVENLQGLGLQQSIAAGSALMGKTVDGINATGDKITGTVTAVKIENQKVLLQLDNAQELPLSSITNIYNTTTGTALAGSLPVAAAASPTANVSTAATAPVAAPSVTSSAQALLSALTGMS